MPHILVHLRSQSVEHDRAGWRGALAPENLAMKAALWMFSDPARLGMAQTAAELGGRVLADQGEISSLPFPFNAWTRTRNLPAPPAQSFRAWWRAREEKKS
jgi:L-lactate dehydrogenase complex protein LldF